MSRSFTPFLLCATIVFIAVLAVPATADNVTQTATVTATPTLTATPTSTSTTLPVTTTTVATTTTPATTQTTIIPTTTPTTTVPVITVTTTTTTTPIPTTTGPQIPVAGFSSSPVSGTAPLTVQFTDTSSNTPTSWNWSFGDGNTSTDENPSYTYVTAGTYTVSLTATNTAGDNVDTQSDLITVNAALTLPVADFSQSASSGTTPLTIQFTDDSTNSPISWSWSFGDGNTSTDENPSYTYVTAGSYTVSLTATNAEGSNSTTVADDVTVTEGTSVIPVASFTESETAGNAPLTIQFTDESYNSPTSWTWNFGDGGTSTVENPAYTYANPGSYSVILTATNAAGTNTSVQQDAIRVSTAPVAEAASVPVVTATPQPTPPTVSFEGTPTSGTAPLVVRFTATAPGSPESFAWDFGDGGTSTEQEPVYTYTLPGTYTVELTVKYASGSQSSDQVSYINVGGGSSASSPLSPAVPLLALGVTGIVSLLFAGRRRG